jgi:EmrB/QacA subfamily drug resistance transporter
VKATTKQSNKWLALTTTSVGTFMATLNASIVNIANPILSVDLGVSMSQVQWVATIFLIITSSLMLLFGRLGDRVGSHRVYIVGIAIFTAGSLACALGNSFVLLLLARALQGLGAAMVVATSTGLVATIFPLSQRGRAMGVTVLMVGLGNITGPVVGGFVLAHASWHAVFLLSVPFGAIAFVMALLWLRSPLPKNARASLDIRGSALFTGVVACLILFLSGGFAGQEWFALGFVGFAVLFFVAERREKAPLLDFVLLKNRRFGLGNLVTFFSYCANMMLVFQLPFFLDTVWKIPVGTVGLWMMVSAACLAVSGPASGFVSDRFGALKVMPPALVAVVAAMVVALFFGTEVSLVLFMTVMVLSGAGMGFVNTPNNSDIVTAAGKEHASYASGFVATNRNLGFAVGTALSASSFTAGKLLSSAFPTLLGADSSDVAVHLFSFKAVLLVCLLLVLVSLGICLYLKHGNGQKQASSNKTERN